MVEAALLAAGRPMDAAELARGFKGGGKRIHQGVVAGLNTLVRYGRVTAMGMGGSSRGGRREGFSSLRDK